MNCLNREINCSKENELSISNDIDEILNITKIDLPTALSFFLGKDRGKDSKYITLRYPKVTIKYGSIIQSHILSQIKKL